MQQHSSAPAFGPNEGPDRSAKHLACYIADMSDISRPPLDKVQAIEAWVARLYGAALSAPPQKFRSWALNSLKQLIPFDGALWGSGIATASRFHTVTTVGLPEGFPQRLQATASVNPLLPKILSNLERPVDMESVLDDDAFHQSEVYRQCFGPAGIERILSTGHADPRSGLSSLVSLYRKDASNRFSQEEKQLQLRLTLHLFASASHSFFMHLMRNTEPLDGRCSALVDRHGLYHEAQPQFHDLLDEAFPKRSQSLPFPVPEPGTRSRVQNLCVSCDALDDLFMLQIWKAGPLDELTTREHQVVTAVAQGLSFKQAAKRIGIAPSTVANHLYRIYRKLGVNSRTELARLVYPEEG